MRKNEINNIRSYLREIARYPLLTHDRELELGRIIQSGSSEAEVKAAIAELIRHNLRLTVHVAKKYASKTKSMGLMDLASEGAIGLHRAAEKFDPKMGYKFSTYAYWWVRQAITRAIYDQDSVIRKPVHMNERIHRIQKAGARFKVQNGRFPSITELSELTKMPEEKVREVLSVSVPSDSLNRKVGNFNIGNKSEPTDLLEFVQDFSSSPDEFLFLQQQKEFCERYLDILNDRQREVIIRAFGLHGFSPQSHAAIGHALGVSRERVRQLRNGAMKKLKFHAEQDYQSASNPEFFLAIVE